MDALTILFALTIIGGGGALGWRMWALEQRMNLTQQNTEEKLDEQRQTSRSSLVALHHTLASLEAGTQALLSTQPQLGGRIALHSAIAKSESILDRSITSSAELKEGGKSLISAVRDLIGTIGGDGKLEQIPEGDVGLSTLSRRLFIVLEKCGLGPVDLALNGLECKRLGALAYSVGELNWAIKSYECANLKSPGDTYCLEILEQLSLQTGDTGARRHWLEERLLISPDDPELLRAHAYLMVKLDDDAAERDIRRLEALGIDTPADRSLLSGLRSRAGAKDEALQSLDDALEEDPTRSGDWSSKARIHLELGEHDEALIASEACLSLDRQNGDAWAIKAQVLKDRPSEAKAALKAAVHAVALAAGGTELILLKSDLLAATGKSEEGRDSLISALEKNPTDSTLRAAMAAMSLQKGDLEEAGELLRGTPLEAMDEPLIHIQWGRLHLASADLQRDGTGDTDMRLLLVAKESFDEAVRLNREHGIAWLGLARIQRLLKDKEAATLSLSRASRLLEEDQPAYSTEAALLALDNDDIAEAERLIENASIHDNRSATIPYIKGNIASARGRFEVARSFYSETLAIEPNHSRAMLNRAACSMALDEAHLSLDDCNSLLERAPGLLLARLRRAEASMHLTEWDEAIKDLEAVLENNSKHSHALTRLAACQIALGRPELAEAPLNEALRVDSGNAEAWYQRGLLYMEWERIDASIADFQKAAKANPTHLQSRLHIAASLHGAGRWEEAVDAWKEVLELEPENSVARRRHDQAENFLSAPIEMSE